MNLDPIQMNVKIAKLEPKLATATGEELDSVQKQLDKLEDEKKKELSKHRWAN